MKDFIGDITNWIIIHPSEFSSIILSILAGLFALGQWQKGNKLKRVEFIEKLISVIRSNQEDVEILYRLYNDQGWYNEDYYNTGKDSDKKKFQYLVDKLLSQLNYICYLKKMRIIKTKEYKIIRCNLDRICESSGVQNYLWNLYHRAKLNETITTFSYLIEYGIKHKKIISDEFYMNKKECAVVALFMKEHFVSREKVLKTLSGLYFCKAWIIAKLKTKNIIRTRDDDKNKQYKNIPMMIGTKRKCVFKNFFSTIRESKDTYYQWSNEKYKNISIDRYTNLPSNRTANNPQSVGFDKGII